MKNQWIILTSKLPTEASPPKLTIHYSTPWVNEKFHLDQVRKHSDITLGEYLNGETIEWDETDSHVMATFGREQNESGARAILWDGRALKVFPSEYNIMDSETFNLAILGIDGSPSHYARFYTSKPDNYDSILDQESLDCDYYKAINVASIMSTKGTINPMNIRPAMWWDMHYQYKKFYIRQEAEIEFTSTYFKKNEVEVMFDSEWNNDQ